MQDKNPVLSLEQATHLAAKRAKGGVVAIAAAYGFNPRTFQNSLNPSQTTHTLHAEHLEAVLEYSQSPLILDAIGRLANCTWVPLGNGELGDMAMLDAVTELVTRVGELTRSVQESLDDGRVDQDEWAGLQEALSRLVSAGHGVLKRAEQYMDE